MTDDANRFFLFPRHLLQTFHRFRREQFFACFQTNSGRDVFNDDKLPIYFKRVRNLLFNQSFFPTIIHVILSIVG